MGREGRGTLVSLENPLADQDFMYDPGQDTGLKRPNSDYEAPFQLLDKITK